MMRGLPTGSFATNEATAAIIVHAEVEFFLASGASLAACIPTIHPATFVG